MSIRVTLRHVETTQHSVAAKKVNRTDITKRKGGQNFKRYDMATVEILNDHIGQSRPPKPPYGGKA